MISNTRPRQMKRKARSPKKLHSAIWLTRQLAAAQSRLRYLESREVHAARFDWIKRNAHKEIQIRQTEAGFEVVRWVRRYVTSYDFCADTLEQALDDAIKHDLSEQATESASASSVSGEAEQSLNQ